MCKVLDVSKQGYNKWLKSREKPYKHEALLVQIKEILAEDNENCANYGKQRIFLALRNNKGYTESYSTTQFSHTNYRL